MSSASRIAPFALLTALVAGQTTVVTPVVWASTGPTIITKTPLVSLLASDYQQLYGAPIEWYSHVRIKGLRHHCT